MRSNWVGFLLSFVLLTSPTEGPSAQTASASTTPPAGVESAGADEAESSDEESEESEDVQLEVPSRVKAPPLASARPLASKEDLVAHAKSGAKGRWLTSYGGAEQVLTIAPSLQTKLTELMRSYQTPYAAVVALEPATGRVLAMAEHSESNPQMRGLCTKAIYPAASIFKIVTATALLDAGVGADTSECFHGGKRRLSPKLLTDSGRDSRCYSLAAAMGKSANVVFAKMTMRHLNAQRLRKATQAFGFNRAINFPVPTEMSLAAIPESPFELASTGAGFGDIFLSPLHGALIASVAANKGRWKDPVLFESAVDPSPGSVVMSEAHAAELTEMLEETVTTGTARRIFRQRGFRVPGAVGKTGSLADRNPFRDYSWFVGFAPKENPRVAVAAVVVNEPRWRIRATFLGREAMRMYLESAPMPELLLPAPEPAPVKNICATTAPAP